MLLWPTGYRQNRMGNMVSRTSRIAFIKRKHGSDLLGMYVGETEKNIATAFQRAKENNMLLVLDEVDGALFIPTRWGR